MEIGFHDHDTECLVVWKWNVHGRLVAGGASRRLIGQSAHLRGVRSANGFRGVPFATVDRLRGVPQFRGHEAVFVQSIGPYAVLDTEPFQSQSSGETLTSDIVHELGSITNFAIGIEHALSADRRLYGSFWTDFNAVEEESVANVSGSPFDLYHFGGGYSFLVGSSDVTLGAVVALGSAETSLNLKPPALGSGMVDTSYLRVTFIFGFNFALATGG